MKKVMVALCGFMMLVVFAVGVLAQGENDPVKAALYAGVETIDHTNPSITINVSESVKGNILVDLKSEHNTMVNSYLFMEKPSDFMEKVHSQDGMMGDTYGLTMYLLTSFLAKSEYREYFPFYNMEICLGEEIPEQFKVCICEYLADEENEWDLMILGCVADEEWNTDLLVRDELYVFGRYGVISDGQKTVLAAMITNQEAVRNIVNSIHEKGVLPEELTSWYERNK